MHRNILPSLFRASVDLLEFPVALESGEHKEHLAVQAHRETKALLALLVLQEDEGTLARKEMQETPDLQVTEALKEPKVLLAPPDPPAKQDLQEAPDQQDQQ